jgi:hypothetical protein
VLVERRVLPLGVLRAGLRGVPAAAGPGGVESCAALLRLVLLRGVGLAAGTDAAAAAPTSDAEEPRVLRRVAGPGQQHSTAQNSIAQQVCRKRCGLLA